MAGVTLSIGDMKTRVTLQSPTLAGDAGGAQTPSWTTERTVSAERINAHGLEALANAAQASQTATLRMWYYPAITSAWRVLMDGKPWRIIAPPDHVRDGNRITEIVVQLTEGTVE